MSWFARAEEPACGEYLGYISKLEQPRTANERMRQRLFEVWNADSIVDSSLLGHPDFAASVTPRGFVILANGLGELAQRFFLLHEASHIADRQRLRDAYTRKVAARSIILLTRSRIPMHPRLPSAYARFVISGEPNAMRRSTRFREQIGTQEVPRVFGASRYASIAMDIMAAERDILLEVASLAAKLKFEIFGVEDESPNLKYGVFYLPHEQGSIEVAVPITVDDVSSGRAKAAALHVIAVWFRVEERADRAFRAWREGR